MTAGGEALPQPARLARRRSDGQEGRLVRDRLTAMLVLAALLYGLIIFGVSFTGPGRGSGEVSRGLEVLLVPDELPEAKRNDTATYIAERTQLGSGNTQERLPAQLPSERAQGLDAQVILLRGTPPSVQALVAGSVYVGGATPDAVMDVSERGIDLVMVVGLINGLSHAIMGGKNYKRYEDLRGATIGGQSLTSGITFPLKQVLKSKGLEYPRDYKLVNVGGTADLFAALSSGQIAAAPLAIPLNFAAEEAGFNVIGWYRDVLPNYQLTAMTVRRSQNASDASDSRTALPFCHHTRRAMRFSRQLRMTLVCAWNVRDHGITT